MEGETLDAPARSHIGMAVRDREVNLTYDELAARCAARESLVVELRGQVLALQRERDQAQAGVEFLTAALRRRGCCDTATNRAPPASSL